MTADTGRTLAERRAMARAEAAWLREPDPPRECHHACLGRNCTRRRDCPEPDRLTDALYETKEKP